jgi:hypothetical protein
MAAFHGKKGLATFTGLSFELTSFTVNATADTAEATIMDSSTVTSVTHWKDYLPGFKDWTATAEALEPAAGAGMAALGTESTLTMDCTDGLSYSGTAICTGISITNDANDVGRASMSFQGTAQLSGS